jgi:hypothetical protein
MRPVGPAHSVIVVQSTRRKDGEAAAQRARARPPLTICYEPRTSAALARGRYGPASSPERFAGSGPVRRADAGTHEP